MHKNKNFKELLADVEAIVFDVDGVMTDGGIMPLPDGDFIRKYNAKDGYALAYAVTHGFKIGVISGGFGKTLESRLNRLHIEHKYLGCMDKIAAIDDFIAKTGVKRENLVYMGDDIPDLEVLRYVGIPVAPADACAEVLESVIYVSEYKGGAGAVRDIIEQILRVKGLWALDSKGVIADDSKSVASR
jgi:3-deoxy-D-manno-octulosonate 8-phosphate phosphatase (KDO 8-P phosphatase)